LIKRIKRFTDSIFNEDYFPALGGEFHQKECLEVDWNATSISFSDPRTTEIELHVQKIIDLQNIANNLPDVFSDYKGVIKSLHPAKNVLERAEVPNKTTQPQIGNKRGRSTSKKKDVIANKQKKTGNTTQISVDRPLEDIQCPADRCDPQSNSTMCINTEAGTSEGPRFVVLGNNDEFLRVDEIAINFVETREPYDHKSTIVDCYLSEQIANILQTDLDPKSMTARSILTRISGG
jgi:hypothetical protein